MKARPFPPVLRFGALVLFVLLSSSGSISSASPSAESADADAGFAPPIAELSGRDIYQRVLDNRFESYVQASSLSSGDRAGNVQETRLRMWFKSFRGPDRKPLDGGLLSKTMVKYTHPFDIRHSGYLIINNLDRPSDQFVYLASNRRVRRVNLRGEAVFGTDFSFEDVIPKEVEDADYRRIEDTDLDGIPCFRVEVMPKPFMRSEYSKFEVTIEKERSIPLRTRYWDARELEIKELRVDRASIRQIDDIWVPMDMRMRNLQHESFTRLQVQDIEANPKLARTTFDIRRLEAH